MLVSAQRLGTGGCIMADVGSQEMPTGEPIHAEQLSRAAEPSSGVAVDLSASEESGQETQPKGGVAAEPGAIADDQAASDSAGELEPPCTQ